MNQNTASGSESETAGVLPTLLPQRDTGHLPDANAADAVKATVNFQSGGATGFVYDDALAAYGMLHADGTPQLDALSLIHISLAARTALSSGTFISSTARFMQSYRQVLLPAMVSGCSVRDVYKRQPRAPAICRRAQSPPSSSTPAVPTAL